MEEFLGLYKTFLIKVFRRIVNPFYTNVPLLHLPKTSENLQFSDVFRRYKSGKLIEIWLTHFNGFGR